MLIGQIRLDKSRYMIKTNDRITQVYAIGKKDYMFYKTEKGNLLICTKEVYDCDGECPDKGRTFEMVKAIKNKCGNLIPASHIEELINKYNMAPDDLILTIENYCEPFTDKTINKIMKRIVEKYPMFDL